MEHKGEASNLVLERFRQYLLLLARCQLGAVPRGKLDPSDIVQETLLYCSSRSGSPCICCTVTRPARTLGRRRADYFAGDQPMTPSAVRIGNQTSKSAPALLPYEFALAHGFDAFEWFSDRGRQGWCEQDMDATARLRLRQTVTERNIRFSVHAPYWADPVQLDGAWAIYTSIEFASDVAAGVVNLHLFPEHPPEVFADALAPILQYAARANVRLSLENTPQTTPDHFNAVFTILAALPEAADGRVGMCLDMGHANLCAATRNNYLGFVDRLEPQVPIIHWHAHENWGDRDSHLPLFTGPSAQNDAGIRGLVQRLARRGFAGSVVLEQWPHPPELLVQARNRLRALFETCAG